MAKSREKELLRIESDNRYTPAYKQQLLKQIHREYVAARDKEEERVREELKREERQAYRKINKRETGTSSLQDEMRLANIREELLVELRGGANAGRLYEEAVRVGDENRMRLLSIVGPHFIDKPAERMRFANLVRANETEAVRRAREKLEENERDTFVFNLGSSIRKGLNSRRERRLSMPPPDNTGYDFNTPLGPLP